LSKIQIQYEPDFKVKEVLQKKLRDAVLRLEKLVLTFLIWDKENGVTAKGNGDQRIYLWPQLKMAAVITGGNHNVQFTSNQLLINNLAFSY
jgi:hypothetical protein